MKENDYYCLNCKEVLKLDEDEEDEAIISITCENCAWKTELTTQEPLKKKLEYNYYEHEEVFDIFDPITYKEQRIDENHILVCYPPLKNEDMEELPELAVKYLKLLLEDTGNLEPELRKKARDNLRKNFYLRNDKNFERLSKKYENKAKLVRFLKKTNLFK